MDAPALAPTDTQADEDTLARQTQDEYDQIPDLYQSSKQLPFRTYVEAPSMLALLGPDVARQSIIDLACGEGFYTRKIRNMGCPDVSRRNGSLHSACARLALLNVAPPSAGSLLAFDTGLGVPVI